MGARIHTALCVGALVSIVPHGARAYSDAVVFAAPTPEGGGGGRFYTGSPADGYGCDTCHAGGAAPRVEVAGLPQRYVQGATYELRVSWPASLEHAAMLLEFADERGMGAGRVALPPPAMASEDTLCQPREDELLAAQLHAAERDRTIVAVPDCGAQAAQVQWTAPEGDVGPVWLAGAVVASNHDGSFTGDGVSAFSQPIPPLGESLPTIDAVGRCSLAEAGVSARSQSRADYVIAFIVLLLLLAIVRARWRTAMS